MFFFPFLCSAIPDLDLGILKMLICVCFCDVLNLIYSWHDITQPVCTVNVQYLEKIFAIYKY